MRNDCLIQRRGAQTIRPARELVKETEQRRSGVWAGCLDEEVVAHPQSPVVDPIEATDIVTRRHMESQCDFRGHLDLDLRRSDMQEGAPTAVTQSISG